LSKQKKKNIGPASGKEEKVAEESDQGEKPPEQPAKKRQKEPLEVQEQRLAPKPSFWPFVLAVTLVLAFIGVMTSPIILAIGAILTIAAIIGWMLEKH
jgi:hypothetical protein